MWELTQTSIDLVYSCQAERQGPWISCYVCLRFTFANIDIRNYILWENSPSIKWCSDREVKRTQTLQTTIIFIVYTSELLFLVLAQNYTEVTHGMLKQTYVSLYILDYAFQHNLIQGVYKYMRYERIPRMCCDYFLADLKVQGENQIANYCQHFVFHKLT